MRTKTVLLSAACGLIGSLAANAQSVYSVNAVGYVNVSIPANAYVMLANPLNTTNNTIGTLVSAPPDFTSIYKFNGTSYDIATYIGGWDLPDMTLAPGEGVFINSPEAFVNTFVGEVMQGDLSVKVGIGYTMIGSQVPQTGTATDLGLTPVLNDFDAVYIFNGTSYDIYTIIGGAWDPADPTIELGHSVFLNTGAAVDWKRTFNINSN
jgi:hypothetical protein